MSFWFDRIPDSYPTIDTVVASAADQADLNGPDEGIRYLQGVLEGLPDSPVAGKYSDYVRFEYAVDRLRSPTMSLEARVGTFAILFVEPNPEIANEVADVGKQLSRSDAKTGEDRETGRALLRFAADSFEKIVLGLPENTTLRQRFELLVMDYARIAALQDEAGDRDGAAVTASMVAPHLIALHGEGRLTKIQQRALDSELGLVARYIGESNPVLFDQLIKVLSQKEAYGVRRTIEEERITRLIISARGEDVRPTLRLYGEEPSSHFWHYVHRLARDETNQESLERAEWLVDNVAGVFPDLFDRADELLLNMLPVEMVLFFVGRDDLLARYYASVVVAQGVHGMSRFAGECGARGDSARFQTMVAAVGLMPVDSGLLYRKYFEPNRDQAQQT